MIDVNGSITNDIVAIAVHDARSWREEAKAKKADTASR